MSFFLNFLFIAGSALSMFLILCRGKLMLVVSGWFSMSLEVRLRVLHSWLRQVRFHGYLVLGLPLLELALID